MPDESVCKKDVHLTPMVHPTCSQDVHVVFTQLDARSDFRP